MRLLWEPRVVGHARALGFEGGRLQPGDFARAEPLGERPGDGFRLPVRPFIEGRQGIWRLLIGYRISSINNGDMVTPEQGEQYGATLLGLGVETWYSAVCEWGERIAEESSA